MPLPPLDRLIAAAQAGDRAAYGQLVEACFDDVAAFVAVRVSRRQAIDEIVQSTFVDGWLAIGTYRSERSLQAWLVGIARHRLLRWWREHGRDQRLVPIEAAADLQADLAGEPERSSEELARLRRCLQQVPEAARALLRARHVEEVQLYDLATRAGLSANALATRLCRWRSALRACIERREAMP